MRGLTAPPSLTVAADNQLSPIRGFKPRDVARRWCVGVERVLRWIKSGELAAINVSDVRCRPRYVVLPEAVADFERRRHAATPTPPKPKPRKRRPMKDYYPD